ncbi:cardiolipin synthase B [Acidocella aquatica]|uniref:Phospholipase D n=1 Tax=Acidocella aquatica TaxID=1922313 RepID=A0ABQ6A5U7_9PROT|nr:phospholipase D-like domain-containing protein [Acidocella aquatica]GLR67825.1 cardiolipin synthase B [Acidocella aquatica]
MSSRLRRAAILALTTLTGCVTMPQIDPDLACDIPTANEAQALTIMRAESIKLTNTPFVPGNSVHLLENGPTTYAAMQSAISGAKQRIDLESYEFDGPIAVEFAQLLIAEHALGIQVDLIYDAYGTNAPPGLFDDLRRNGVNVLTYSPLTPASMLTMDINRRDHRKLLIIDGAIAFTGGINIAQVYENHAYKNHRYAAPASSDPAKMPWRDTDVEVTGPVVSVFEQLFMQTWTEQKGPPIPAPPPTSTAPQGDSTVQALDGSPKDSHPAIYKTLLTAIAAARKSIHLTTGFFAPPPDLLNALQCAARRGVDVRIIVPSTSTSDSSIAAGRANYGDLLEAGVHIYERHGAVLHAKTAVIDGAWSLVGSANLDWRSVVFNNEIDAVVLGQTFGAEMETQFRKDTAASTEITLTNWRRRSLNERLNEFRARLIEFML